MHLTQLRYQKQTQVDLNNAPDTVALPETNTAAGC